MTTDSRMKKNGRTLRKKRRITLTSKFKTLISLKEAVEKMVRMTRKRVKES